MRSGLWYSLGEGGDRKDTSPPAGSSLLVTFDPLLLADAGLLSGVLLKDLLKERSRPEASLTDPFGDVFPLLLRDTPSSSGPSLDLSITRDVSRPSEVQTVRRTQSSNVMQEKETSVCALNPCGKQQLGRVYGLRPESGFCLQKTPDLVCSLWPQQKLEPALKTTIYALFLFLHGQHES